MNRYEFYENTGLDWVPEIPEHWSLTRSKYIFRNKSVKNCPDEPLLSVTQKDGVVLRSESDLNVWNPTEDVSGYKLIEPTNFVISLRSFEGGLELSTVKGIVSPAYTVLEKTRKINDPYFRWLMKSHQFIIELNKHVTGIRQGKNIGWDDFSNIYLTVPPTEEQKLISRYLDKKTSQIDSLVEKIQKKIELLKEQRTSLINHYVTKGLDPNVEMKDSGVEWIGEIPKHWKTLRLCNFGLFSKGKNITKGDLVELGKPVILYSHLYTTYSRLVKEPKFFISDDFELNSTKIYKNTFLFTSSGESKEDIGKCILYVGDETSVGGDQVIFKLKSTCNFDPEFLSFSFNSDFCVNQKSSNSRGEIVVHIYEKQLRDVVIPIPPENEQIVIRSKLRKIEKNSDEIIRNLEHKRELLKEYRQSLISSVVTGKVRVTEDMI